MSLQLPVALKGAPGSPYTRKMLAVLRYRRIPYRLIVGRRDADDGMPRPKVDLLPTFFLPDSHGTLQAVVDSTPIIRRLESEVPGRSVLPRDPAMGFIDELLEDYADEWLTKAMFHYRWHFAEDIDKAGDILPRWRSIDAPEATHRALKAQFSERQIARLRFVGSSDATAAVIEGSYRRFLDVFERHLAHGPFLMGRRPGASDFGIYGQLTQLAHFDPTPAALTLARAKRVYAWVGLVDDLSGLEPADDGWTGREAIPATLVELLREVGRVYVPVMLANLDALAAGADRVQTEVDGQPWVQQPFPYQGRCVQWLRESHARLSDLDRAAVGRIIQGTGCERLLGAGG
jgi:glutathione S-transferase